MSVNPDKLAPPPMGGGLPAYMATVRAKTLYPRMMTGSLILLVGSGLMTLVNLAYNVGIARLLGPAGFGHAAALYTLLMLISAVTLSFQLVCAKFVARNETRGAKASVYRDLLHRAWGVGLVGGTALILARNPVSHYLNLPSPNLVVLLGIAVAFYIPLGVRRGAMQGTYAFLRLALSFLLESVVKLAGAFALIDLGYGVTGAMAAIAFSVVFAYFVPPLGREMAVEGQPGVPASFREGLQVIVFFVGQVIINNVDILLVKHFFPPPEAGLYATAALVGRAVYFLSWSVISAMFPISAASTQAETRDGRAVVIGPMVMVVLITLAFTLALVFSPQAIFTTIFGKFFEELTGKSYLWLLVLYAVMTGIYALSVVLMAYEMSRRIANTGWVQLAFSGAIVLGIYLLHSSLLEVALVQLVAMLLLLATVSMPFLPRPQAPDLAVALVPSAARRPIARKLRRLSEAEVISEFLKNEFYQPFFDGVREVCKELVMRGNLEDGRENQIRRELLLRWRGAMWRQLPSDIEWWEVEIDATQLRQIRVLPVAQWRRFAAVNYLLPEIAEQLRIGGERNPGNGFMARIQSLSQTLKEDRPAGSILLIGVNEYSSLTIIEGNHRMTAAVLAPQNTLLKRFSYFCGFSPKMMECCWYRANLRNLLRYAKHFVRNISDIPQTDVAKIFPFMKHGMEASEVHRYFSEQVKDVKLAD